MQFNVGKSCNKNLTDKKRSDIKGKCLSLQLDDDLGCICDGILNELCNLFSFWQAG